MKKFSLIIYLIIIGYIFSISTIENTLFDCEYETECTVNMESFTDGYIPSHTKLYLRLPINMKNRNAINIKLYNNEDCPDRLEVYFFSKKPTDEEAISGGGNCDFAIKSTTEKDRTYTKYIYPIDEDYTGKYIVATFDTKVDYHYLSFSVSSYKKKGYYMKELEYNKEHVIKNLGNYESFYYFWLKARNKDNEHIRIKLHKDDSDYASEVEIRLSWKRVNPSERRDESDTIYTEIFNRYDSNETDTDYIKYYYSYSNLKEEEAKYLEIVVLNDYNLKYFSIGVGNNISDYSSYFKLMPLKYLLFTLLLLFL